MRNVKFLKVEGDERFVRDTSSRGIIHTDIDEYQRYLEEKRKREAKDKRINKLEQEVGEMKRMMSKILEKL